MQIIRRPSICIYPGWTWSALTSTSKQNVHWRIISRICRILRAIALSSWANLAWIVSETARKPKPARCTGKYALHLLEDVQAPSYSLGPTNGSVQARTHSHGVLD